MKRISLDNGLSFMPACCAIKIIKKYDLWDAIIEAMDNDTREDVHTEKAPCTEQCFLHAYLKKAKEDLILG